MSSISSFSNEQCINEVCSSTASLSVSSNPNREYDSPTVVSNSSSTANSDQFEDAPEEYAPSLSRPKASMNPLDALAMACAAEKNHPGQAKEPGQHPRSPAPSTEEGSPTSSFQISQNDVLCGRGGLTNHHPGNVFFRRLVRLKQESYLRASKREKAGVAREIVDIIRNLSPPGRFLKKDSRNPGVWIEIGDRKAREKTSQALREGAPELREELQSDGTQATPDDHQKMQPAFVPDSGQSLLETMKEHQAHSWSQFTPMKEPPQKPLTVVSNRVRVVSDDSNNILGVHRPARPSHHASAMQLHVIVDDQPPPVQPQLPIYPTQMPMYRHPQPFDGEEDSESSRHSAIGGKRKSVDPARSMSSAAGARGPRLKLLKQRLQSDGVES